MFFYGVLVYCNECFPFQPFKLDNVYFLKLIVPRVTLDRMAPSFALGSVSRPNTGWKGHSLENPGCQEEDILWYPGELCTLLFGCCIQLARQGCLPCFSFKNKNFFWFRYADQIYSKIFRLWHFATGASFVVVIIVVIINAIALECANLVSRFAVVIITSLHTSHSRLLFF